MFIFMCFVLDFCILAVSFCPLIGLRAVVSARIFVFSLCLCAVSVIGLVAVVQHKNDKELYYYYYHYYY